MPSADKGHFYFAIMETEGCPNKISSFCVTYLIFSYL